MKHRLKKALKYLFIALHTFLVLALLLGSLALYIVFRPDGVVILNDLLLKPFGIEYKELKGSLLDGLTIHEFHSETIDIKTLALDYNLTSILEGNHTIDSISIDGLRVHLDDFISDEDSSSLPLPTFVLKEVKLTNIQLISSYPIELDISANNGSYNGEKLNFKAINGSIKTLYASGAIKGVIKNNTFSGDGIIYPNAKELNPYVSDFTTLPDTQRIIIHNLSDKGVQLSAHFANVQAAFDEHLTLNNLKLTMDYRFSQEHIDFNLAYLLERDKNHMLTTQKLRYAFNGMTTTSFKGNLTTPEIPLPTSIIEGSFRDDSEGLAGKITLADSTLLLQSSDYDHYNFHAQTHHNSLSFLPFLPQFLQDSTFDAKSEGVYNMDDNSLQGKFSASHNHVSGEGSFTYKNDTLKLHALTSLPRNAPLWRESTIKPPNALELDLTYHDQQTHLSVNGENMALSLENHNDVLKGSGNYLGTFFELTGSKVGEAMDATLTSLTPSLAKTLVLLPGFTPPNLRYYDAEVRTATHITYDETLHVLTTITLPWYATIIDTGRSYGGVDSSLTLRYDNKNIVIDHYDLDVANHRITTDKPSYLHLDDQDNLHLDEIWIYDALRLNGIINTTTLSSSLTLKSDRFSYEGPEGEAKIGLDLQFSRDENASQRLSGNITLLEGKITYLPLQQFKVMDDDVIIVQDVNPPSNETLSMDVKITATKPLHYLTKELDLFITPDLTLWKDPMGNMQVLGIVSIPRGKITTSGKTFTLRPSYLYFAGSVPINPYLDITADYEVDYKKIEIYITHRLDSPMFLFNSDPFMSQNDIISYIIFGAPASTALSNNSGADVSARADATNFMLGAGLKGLIGGATKIQLDTMNILTTKEGGMGFEVGARLNKDLRVLYKNDTVSSVLIQYTVNRWLRLDADIHELGQGINAIYIKDFRDFLPHNKPKTSPSTRE